MALGSVGVDVTEEYRDFVQNVVPVALQIWDGGPARQKFKLERILSISHRLHEEDVLVIAAELMPRHQLCFLRLHETPRKLDIKCGEYSWTLRERPCRQRRDVDTQEIEEIDIAENSFQWNDLKMRVILGLQMLRNKLSVQYMPLNLLEIMEIHERTLLDTEKLFTFDVMLGSPPARCTLKLLERPTQPDNLVVVCDQHEMGITITETHKLKRSMQPANGQTLTESELQKAMHKLNEALSMLEKEKSVQLTLVKVHDGIYETKPQLHQSLRLEFVNSKKQHTMCRAKIFDASIKIKCGKNVHLVSRKM